MRVEPIGPEVVLADENGRLVATTSAPVEPMTQDETQRLIAESRERPPDS